MTTPAPATRRAPVRRRRAGAPSPWRFTASTRPVDDAEAAALAADLDSLGAGSRLLDLYDTLLGVQSARTRPILLRGYRDATFAGAALVMRCRAYGSSFFDPGPLRTLLDAASVPIWYWERTSVGTDGHAGPGLVTAGVERHELVAAAQDWLSRHYLVGAVVEPDDGPPASGTVVRFPDASSLDLQGPGAPARLLAAHSHLARKVRKFTNKGGRLEIVRGAVPAHLHAALLAGYAQPRPIDPPFRALYPRMVEATWALPGDDLVHVVASLGGRVVGYHSFAVLGRDMSCLSGAFDTTQGSTFHAYENVILDSARLGVELGCRTVHYGPAVNAVKRSLLQNAPARLRFVSRWPAVHAALRATLSRTRLAPDRVEAVTSAGH